jgi:hypothetical protein
MDISALRKSRSNDFSKILGEFDKISNPSSEGTKSYEDDRFWQPEVDKAGNGYAVIRFLPRVEGDEFPWVRVFSHGFQGPTGKWYIENSLTTLGENDPVGELNSKLWNSGSEANKEIARKQKRRLTYIANVLIINDPAHPELNGQVKLFKFGKKIFDKIMDKARPTFEDEKPVLVFDLWEGCNFKLKIRKVDGYRNYDKSEFESPTALFDGEEDKLLELVGRQYKLSEFTDRKNFKTYEELARRLNAVLNPDGAGTATAASMVEEEEEVAPAPTLKAVSSRPAPSKPAPSLDEDDEDDAMSYFQKLANDN